MHLIAISTVLLPLVGLTMATYVPMLCNCGLSSGEDVCHHQKKDCSPLVVRPCELPKPKLPTPRVVCAPVGGIPPLVPIGDPCSCHASLVKPAILPKPPCAHCCSKTDLSMNHHLNINQQHQVSVGGCLGHHGVIGAAPVPGPILTGAHPAGPIMIDSVVPHLNNPAQLAPADAVSLAVAYKQAHENCHQSEGKLSFGFRTIPKEIPVIKKKLNNLREENLYNLNGQIMELKKTSTCAHKSVDEEAMEELLETSDEDKIAIGGPKTITLGELGYGPAKIKSASFINVPAANPIQVLEDSLTSGKKCEDGFRPGNVMISQVPKPNCLSFPRPYPEPCAETGIYLPPPPPCPFSYSASSSQSSQASSNNKYSSSIMFQKLGCE